MLDFFWTWKDILVPLRVMLENEVSLMEDKLATVTHQLSHQCPLYWYQKCFKIKTTLLNHRFHHLQYHLYQTWYYIKTTPVQTYCLSTRKDMKAIATSRRAQWSQEMCMEAVQVKYQRCLGRCRVIKAHRLQVNSMPIPIIMHRIIHLEDMGIWHIDRKAPAARARLMTV